MNTTERNEFVKSNAAKAIGIAEIGKQIDRFTWAIPVEVEGETLYAKVSIVAAQAKATKVNPAFDIDEAVAAFAEAEATRLEKAAEAAAKKAAKTKKSAKE